MSKKILAIALTAVLGFVLAAPASAAVQSVRVGGDLVTRMIYRDNVGIDDNSGAWLMNTARFWIGAELTDQVSALVRVLNEREWGQDVPAGGEWLDLDLAYLSVDDLFLPGLSLTLGRQEILLGRGFVVGNVNPAGNWNVRAQDLTARKSLDAIRLDYDLGVMPIDVTLFGAKINEGWNVMLNDDTDLWGINVANDLGNAVLENYVLFLKNRAAGNDIWTIGMRVNHEVFSMPGLNWDGELAYQTGDIGQQNLEAWAGALDVSYVLPSPYMTTIGAGYAYYSGDDGAAATKVKAFQPMFPDDQGSRVGYLLNAIAVEAGLNAAWSNLHAFKVYGSLSPADGHEMSLAVFPALRLDETDPKRLGMAVDLGYNFAYTEDLSLGLLAGYGRLDSAMAAAAGVDSRSVYQLMATVALSF